MPEHADDRTGLVLLHGSELGGWVWEPVSALLPCPALAPDLPGRGSRPADRSALTLQHAVDAVVDDVRSWGDRPVVLVAHSFSGVLAPAVALGLDDRVRAVVWLGATVPQPGRAWISETSAAQRLLLRTIARFRPDGVLSPRKESLRLLCNDLDASTAGAALERRVPEVWRYLLDPVRVAALPAGVASHFVRLTQDQAQTPELRERSLARLPSAEVHELDAGHLPMLSRPAELAALLAGIARRYDTADDSRH